MGPGPLPTMAASTWIDANQWGPTKGQCSEETTGQTSNQEGRELQELYPTQVRLIGGKVKLESLPNHWLSTVK